MKNLLPFSLSKSALPTLTYPLLWFVGAGISIVNGSKLANWLSQPMLVQVMFVAFWLTPALSVAGIIISLLRPDATHYRWLYLSALTLWGIAYSVLWFFQR